MLLLLARRIAASVGVLFCVVTITFFLIRLSPGGPFDTERKIPPAIEKELLAKYQLDGPIWQQYVDYLRDLLRGDLRLSTKYRNRTVNEILAQTLPVTMALGAAAFALATTVGIWAGSLAALGFRRFPDQAAMTGALLAISVPSFVAGPLWILVFAIHWKLLPVGGWGGLSHLILPAVTLATPYAAYIARLTRGSLLETLQADFIRTARAKGLREGAILSGHALRIALLPVVSFLGPLAAHLLTGSIVVETIFHIPGAGSFFVHSILNKDAFLLGGVVIVYCLLLVAFNFVVDLMYSALDPRIERHA